MVHPCESSVGISSSAETCVVQSVEELIKSVDPVLVRLLTVNIGNVSIDFVLFERNSSKEHYSHQKNRNYLLKLIHKCTSLLQI